MEKRRKQEPGLLLHITAGYDYCMFSFFILLQNYIKDIFTRIGTCNVNRESNRPQISFCEEAFAVVRRHLGVPDQFLEDIPTNHILRTTAFCHSDSSKRFLG